MIRPLFPLLPVLLFAACAAPQAVVVEEVPSAKPKPAAARPSEAAGEAAGEVVPRTVQQGGMRVPDLAERLPERKDMTPTAAPAAGGGPTVIATPPPGP
jgi:hypothetical protein